MFVLFKKTKERNLNHKLICILVFLYIITCLIQVSAHHARTHNFCSFVMNQKHDCYNLL